MKRLKAEKRETKRQKSTKHMASLSDQLKRPRPRLIAPRIHVKKA